MLPAIYLQAMQLRLKFFNMPVNLSARFRHEVIDTCLRNKAYKWTKKKLTEVVNNKLEGLYNEPKNVSDRTILKDLQDMQSAYGAPIDKKGKGNDISYYYSEPDFSIINLHLSEIEILKLNEAIHLLKQIKGFTIADDISNIIQRLENKVKIKSENVHPIIAFENPPIALGNENLEDIYTAILSKSALKITYQPFKHATSSTWIIHPYFLKEYNNRWFLIGLYNETKTLGIYALDRMKEIKVCNVEYTVNTVFNADEYFKNIIGVTKLADAKIEKVVFTVGKERADYLITKPLHASQKISRVLNNSIEFEIIIIINKELVSLLLSFGKDLTVTKPQSLVNILKEEFNTSLKNYNDRS